ncbi:hypothetical protein TNCV_2267561 [Trichonephila clavipes]|nr:hypothetical protein TNCV_2267561 [Trichonephila clavipes]
MSKSLHLTNPSKIVNHSTMDSIWTRRLTKRSLKKKVSPALNLTSFQQNATSPQPKKVSSPLEPKPNPSLFVELTSPTPPKGSLFTSEFILQNIRSKPKVSIPEASAPFDRVILKAWRPPIPRI